MHRGFVRQWRKELESEVFTDPDPLLYKVWSWIKLRANHKPGQWRGRVVKPGQFVTSILLAADVFGTSRPAIRRRLDRLQEMGNIVRETSARWTVITVCNWATYAEEGVEKASCASAKRPRNVRETSAKRPQSKNEKNEENTNTPLTPQGGDNENSAKDRNAKHHPRSESDPPGFAAWYEAYPVKKARGDAVRAWRKLSPLPELQIALLAALPRQVAERAAKAARGEFVPEWKFPATWLNKRCWEDSLDQSVPSESPSEADRSAKMLEQRRLAAEEQNRAASAEEVSRILGGLRNGRSEGEPKPLPF